MARSGWSASNFLRCGSAPVTAAPFTLAGWGMTSISLTTQALFGLYNSGSTGDVSCFKVQIGGDILSCQVADAAVTSFTATGSVSLNTWFHFAAVEGSSTDHRVFLNGGGKGTSAVSRVPSGINRVSAGLRDNVSADRPLAPAGNGSLAELGMWNIALSDADVLALSKGLSPLRVHPEALVAYWPLIGNNSPENNLKSNAATMAIQGSLSKSAHPRIIMPKRHLIW